MPPKSPIEKRPRPHYFSRRELLVAAGAVAAASILPGCGGGSLTTPPNPDPQQPIPSGPTTASTIVVQSETIGSIGPAFAGFSYEKGAFARPLFVPSNSNLIGLFSLLGPSILRIGGNTVDETTWNPSGHGQTANQASPSDVDNLALFLKSTGWKVLYGVNLAQSTPDLAAAEAAYAQQSLGSSLAGIEIGNEPDLFGGHYFPNPWTYAEYIPRWKSFAAAILNAAPNIVLTGPALGDPNHIPTWMVPFAQDEGSTVKLLTQHYYRGNGQSSSSNIHKLLSPDAGLQSDLAKLAVVRASTGLPIRMAEENSFYNGGAPNISDSYASALWVIDNLFYCAIGGLEGVNLHGGGHGPGYTPIADQSGVVVEARPEYYGMLLFTLAGQGTVLNNTLNAGDLNASSYAVKSASGQLKLVVVNKDDTNSLALAISPGQPVSEATLLLLTGPSLSATSGVTIQGSAVSTGGAFNPGLPYALPISGETVTAYVNPASAALITLS